ncbi:MAG: radical SAM protein [Bdellovibrionales bacterium RIFCSPHIGHO2_01_FULL_40_29]|nr:MAG: radical SAM protein [Bdellovibrionales bacterium RIFCSPHIGHO2_01_FULL_40_29]OFZ33544.1 MAG: radical SAM protein [Bdellovibrionales bacterium RIFCSPHIGHO2_02_FULL_40_15]
MKTFMDSITDSNLKLNRKPVEILQINIGRLCNLACHHCHVEAGPKRTENMDSATVDKIIELLAESKTIQTVDLTGGAPELNPHFRRLVTSARELKKTVIDRCNLTVLYEPGQEETAFFLKENNVHIVASLPCYSKKNVEQQRGRGVFDKSIEALKLFNKLGYGKFDSNLKMDLVYNPTGPFLPPAQEKLQHDYKIELKELFDIEFNELFTITNMPIKRFLNDLERSGKWTEYMELLANSFNPTAAKGIMCRNLVSVSWNGDVFDCDFNQMLELPLGAGRKTLWDLTSFDELENKPITFANHCYACTAGAGSSCGGALV